MRFEEQNIDDFTSSAKVIGDEMVRVLRAKRLSYGPHNLTRFGLTGIVIRASDKIDRLATMTQSNAHQNADGDSMEDALKDLIGYGILGLLYYRMNMDETCSDPATDD